MLFSILQAAGGADALPLLPSLGIGGGVAAFIFYIWRNDRDLYTKQAKESQERYAQLAQESQDRYAQLAQESQERYAQLAAESQARYAEIAKDFRLIVQDNTRAVTTLGEKFGSSDAVTVRLLLEALRKNKVVNVE